MDKNFYNGRLTTVPLCINLLVCCVYVSACTFKVLTWLCCVFHQTLTTILTTMICDLAKHLPRLQAMALGCCGDQRVCVCSLYGRGMARPVAPPGRLPSGLHALGWRSPKLTEAREDIPLTVCISWSCDQTSLRQRARAARAVPWGVRVRTPRRPPPPRRMRLAQAIMLSEVIHCPALLRQQIYSTVCHPLYYSVYA